MASQRQIEANRRNSQLSTGPRTTEGKAASRFNALKSGINAKAQVLPGEDPAELEAMAAGYHQDWAPTTWLERFLVDSLIRADWLLQRLSRIEAQLWAFRMEEARKSMLDPLSESTPLGHMYYRLYEPLTHLQRRIDSTERSYYRALAQLQRLRSGDPREPEFLSSAPLSSDPVPSAPASSPREPVAELASFCPSPSVRSQDALCWRREIPPTRLRPGDRWSEGPGL